MKRRKSKACKIAAFLLIGLGCMAILENRHLMKKAAKTLMEIAARD